MAYINAAMRDALIDHMDGKEIPIVNNALTQDDPVASARRKKTVEGLVGLGYLRLVYRDGTSTAKATAITESGRRALNRALGDWADALSRVRAAEQWCGLFPFDKKKIETLKKELDSWE